MHLHSDHCYIWREKTEVCSPEDTAPTMKFGAVASFCVGVLLQEGPVHL